MKTDERMSKTCYVVTYTGPFGFIKPWTAVRDELTYSQQFLTPSMVEGMRQKLDVSEICRHRLTHDGFSVQGETTQSAGIDRKTVKKRQEVTYNRATAVLDRGVMLNPRLHLAFPNREDAENAHQQHLCLSRNEDVVMPDGPIREMTETEFDELAGFELVFGQGDDAFMVGYNRYENGAPMYGTLDIIGDPVSADRTMR
jgi:hypothetical protein